MPENQLLEIAVQDAEGARAAAAAGADRLELCQGLSLGGLTPSRALLEDTVRLNLPVRVLIRPRAGGYRYTSAEAAVMIHDAAHALEAGAEGVIVGALTVDGLDSKLLSELVSAADGHPVVLHRCADVLLAQGWGPQRLAEELIGLGITGVLSSGGAPTAAQGTDVLSELASFDALEVIAGGGIRAEQISAFSAVDAVHLSASSPVTRGSSGPGGGEENFPTTDADLVSAARAALDSLNRL
ncbi:copper homeostasis protein CutC [Nesterenkonia sp. MY13]|uniref:Copper homeostasis protein cutC homolog n=1 Tax=Nesterenkonia sedimenti TaxID=1463632 RepID=A0A7X8TJW3_9MICC|nr:copper homeostasis protein CutC [Nesterenkonia sedimenti]NLS09707.1 copper homeostasis protein CutC [Nesterenkonia sedimenti]